MIKARYRRLVFALLILSLLLFVSACDEPFFAGARAKEAAREAGRWAEDRADDAEDWSREAERDANEFMRGFGCGAMPLALSAAAVALVLTRKPDRS